MYGVLLYHLSVIIPRWDISNYVWCTALPFVRYYT